MDQVYAEMTLSQFAKETPWLARRKRNAKVMFCNRAFEIAWCLEKATFLVK